MWDVLTLATMVHQMLIGVHLQPPMPCPNFGGFRVCGESSLDDALLIENVAAHFPAGTSVKDMLHYEQFIKHGNFARTATATSFCAVTVL